jgi:hypothetical protein
MRRRNRPGQLSADETVALLEDAQRAAAGLPIAEANAHVNRVLREHGTDVLVALRARRWIHRGRRPHERWRED